MSEVRVREQKARRALKRRDLQLRKSKARDAMSLYFGLYQILDGRHKPIVGWADLEYIESWIEATRERAYLNG